MLPGESCLHHPAASPKRRQPARGNQRAQGVTGCFFIYRLMPRKRKESGSGSSSGKEKPGQRNAANARERARMRVLSKAFCRLKTTLPWVPADTKLSKLDTLRLATSYIAHLRTILTEEAAATPSDATPSIHPLNLQTWPFSFQRTSGGEWSSTVHPPSPDSLSADEQSDTMIADTQHHHQGYSFAHHNSAYLDPPYPEALMQLS